jgi:hypothetical protein
MNQRTLRQHIRDHYEAQSLPPAVMDRLIETIETADGGRRTSAGRMEPTESVVGGRRRLLRGIFSGMAALLVIGIAVGLWVGGQPGAERALAEQIAREVALNHHKAFAPEIKAGSFAELGKAMGKLDFKPVFPTRRDVRGMRLIGGRYCSIGDCVAVQATVVMPDGRRGTLYEVRPNKRLEAVEEAELVVKGLRVRLWREGGLLFVLAEPLTQTSA